MESIVEKLERTKLRIADYACPICKSKKKYIDEDIEALVMDAPNSEYADQNGFIYVPCVHCTCEYCGYLMQFTFPKHEENISLN